MYIIKSFALEYLTGYWLMTISNTNGDVADEHVLHIDTNNNIIGGTIQLLYAFDEKQKPVKVNYNILYVIPAALSNIYQPNKYKLYLYGGDCEECPKSLTIDLDIHDGSINIYNGDTSFGYFIKDNSVGT